MSGDLVEEGCYRGEIYLSLRLLQLCNVSAFEVATAVKTFVFEVATFVKCICL